MPRPKHRTRLFSRLLLQRLEDRLAPAAIAWDGGANTLKWTDAKNWSTDTLPGLNDDVTINVPGNITVHFQGSPTTIQSLNLVDNLTITSGSLTVSGALSTGAGSTLQTAGIGVGFSAFGATSANATNLIATGGSKLSLPSLTSYNGVGAIDSVLSANGTGSVLDLPALTNVTGAPVPGQGLGPNTGVTFQASGGGVVNAAALTQIIDPAAGSLLNRRFVLTADGAGSRVDLSALTAFVDQSTAISNNENQGVSRIEATNGGELHILLLTSLNNTNLTIAGTTSVVPVAQFTKISNAVITVSGTAAFTGLTDLTRSTLTATGGANMTLPSLTTLDGTSLGANGGSKVSLPALTSYNGVGAIDAVLSANGLGSVLDLSVLTNVAGAPVPGQGLGPNTGVTFQASAGGVVNAAALTQIIDPAAGSLLNRRFVLTADGAGSRIDLSALTAFVDQSTAISNNENQGVSRIEATNGGELHIPLLTSLNNTNLTIAGITSVVPVAQFTKINNAVVAISAVAGFAVLTDLTLSALTVGGGVTLTLPNLTKVDGTSFGANGGSKLSLPALASYIGVGAIDAVLSASGTGSVLDLPTLTNVAGAPVPGQGLGPNTGVTFRATGGGVINATALTQIIDPTAGILLNRRFVLAADGTGSRVDLSALTMFVDQSTAISNNENQGVSRIEATNGGEIQVPLLASLDNTNLTITGNNSVVPVVQITSISNAAVAIGVAATFVGLTELTRSVFTASGSTSLTFPNLSKIDGTSLLASGGTKLSLPALTSYNGVGANDAVLSASGTGTVLDLPALTNVTGAPVPGQGLGPNTGVTFQASAGGVVNAAALTQIIDPAAGSLLNRRFVLTADGAGSRIDLSALTAFVDQSTAISNNENQGVSRIEATNGGDVHIPLLASLNNTNLTSLNGGRITTAPSLAIGNVVVNLNPTGTLDVANLNAGPQSQIIAEGTLKTNIVSAGIIDIRAGATGGILAIQGDLTLAPTSVVFCDIGGPNPGTDYNQISVAGQVIFDGTLGVTFFNGYVAAPGVSYQLLKYSSRQGEFAAFTGINAGTVNELGRDYSPITFTLRQIENLAWDGGGNNLDWTDRRNWASDVVPHGWNQVTVGGSFTDPIVIPLGSSASVFSLQSAAGLQIDGDLSVSTTATLSKSVAIGRGASLRLKNASFSVTSFPIKNAGTVTLINSTLVGISVENSGRIDVPAGQAANVSQINGALSNARGGSIRIAAGGAANNASPTTLKIGGGLTNQGSIELTQTGVAANDTTLTITAGGFANTGTLRALFGTAGGTRAITKTGIPIQINDPSAFTVEHQATLAIQDSLGGDSKAGGLFNPDGTVLLNSGGTSVAPQFLEAFSKDVGAIGKGLVNNFRIGTLRLASTYVKLVDNADNDNTADTESLYVENLIVPAGSTLDLNGLKAYARTMQKNGTIVGNVQIIPDKGTLPFQTQVAGTISNVGETDSWTFFGRAGQTVSLFANPGDSNAPPPVFPTLAYVDLKLLNPTGVKIGEAVSTAIGQSISLPGSVLTADGVYTVQISAPPTQPNVTGNYTLLLADATATTRSLVLSQQEFGVLSSALAVDHWTFSAPANTQVRFHLASAGSTQLRFRLSGPNGWTGFADQSGDTGLVTLPTDGNYALDVSTTGYGQGAYAFQLNQTNQTTLTLGTPFNGTLVGSGDARLFKIVIPSANPLLIDLSASLSSVNAEVYIKLGSPPTRQSFDYRNDVAGAIQSVQIPFAVSGTYYVLVYGESVPAASNFTIRALSSSVILTGVTPDHYSANQTASLILRGGGFLPGTQVALIAANSTVYSAQSQSIDATSQITATFNLTGTPIGTYDVRITLPNNNSTTLAGGFQVLAAGQAHLETHLVLPSVLGRHAVATVYVEYANTGNAAMPAPILVLQSNDSDDSDKPFLTLDQSRLTQGFWTSALPDGFSHSIQIYASGATPGVLLPGERYQVPVYFAGLQLPWDINDSAVEFSIGVHDAGDTTAINWPSLQTSLQPSWIAADAWSAVFANLQNQIGPTWGNYVQMLSDNANYLNRLGQKVSDVGQLYSFEVQQAIGISPVASIATATDAEVPTPGLPLTFTRTFGNTITDRYQVGLFGRGWSTPWQATLQQLVDGPNGTNGTVIVKRSAEEQRRFQPDSRHIGSYFSQAGDTGTLRKVSGGAFELTESDGEVTRFRTDGRIDYVQDTNTNRITAGYSGIRLTSLTHTSGVSISITYNAAGLIQTITDSVGRQSTYDYDPTNTILQTVTNIQGLTSYGYYNDPTDPGRRYALASVQEPSGLIRSFAYDAPGRLVSTSLPAGTEQISFTYTVGRVTATDVTGVANKLYFDHRRLLSRVEDTTGNYVLLSHNTAGQLTRVVDSTGRTVSASWTTGGQLVSLTDQLGHTTSFTPGGPNNQPLAFTDANGNVTSYGYDPTGNVTSTTYADGTVERAIYDAVGNPTTLTNRRGQVTTRTPNADGQVAHEVWSEGTTFDYQYDSRKRLWKAISAQGTTTFEYYPTDELMKVTNPDGRWVHYTYTGGRRTKMDDISGFAVNYEYDPVTGRLWKLRDNAGNLLVQYTYLAGRLSREDKGNGTYTIHTYDSVGRIEHIVHHTPGGSINSRFDYMYDTAGNLTQMVTSDGTWDYSYDLTGQLTHAVFVSTNVSIPNQDETFVYDALGNRVMTIINGITTTYVTNSMNQYTSVGTTAISYDSDGNLIQEAGPNGTTNYTFNSQNQLIQVTSSQGVWLYAYDAFGDRTSKTVSGQETDYLLDLTGLVNVVGEYNVAGTRTASYTHGHGLESVTTATGNGYFDFDAVGSTAGISGTAGSYAVRAVYDPFGRGLSGGVASAFGFVGQYGVMAEGNDLIFMRARYYSTSMGRFGIQDALRIGAGDPNTYRYALNAPHVYNDPSGHFVFLAPLAPLFVPFAGPAAVAAATEAFVVAAIISGAAASIVFQQLNNPVEPSGPETQASNPEPDPEIETYTSEPYGPFPMCPIPDPTSDPAAGGVCFAATSIDPNEKFGAAGFGAFSFIAGARLIPYRIGFENLGPGSIPMPAQPATAPAQRVEVTDQLSINLDWSTLQFSEFGFGDNEIVIPNNQQYYHSVVPMTFGGLIFNVEVELSFNPVTGLLRTVFQSIDPESNLPPDVLTGFLPPEDGTGIGKGFVLFSVRPKAALPTGIQLRNVALISFDGQTVIATNQIDPQNPAAGTDPNKEALNTIDAGAPSSSVISLPATSPLANFQVQWSGQDDAGGSGIAMFDVYVSINGGAFNPWLLGTTSMSATYQGSSNTTYSFYSVAVDHVANRQSTPTGAQATTHVPIQPPRIASYVINDGATNRSRVTSLTVTFNELVILPGGTATAFQLMRNGPGMPNGTVGINVDLSPSTASQTIARLTFAGPLTEFGSLMDGTYTFTVSASQVNGPTGLSLDGDENGTSGGDYRRKVFRLFGDADGDRDVDATDFGAFRLSLGGSNPVFDFDNDGGVSGSDFGQFRTRFGSFLPTGSVENVFVNTGDTQRSRITSLKVVFTSLVTFPSGPTAAVQVVRIGPGGPSGAVTVAADLAQSIPTQTIMVLTFSGPLTEYSSLIDGRYKLTLFGNQVQADGQLLDGDDDGVSGGNLVFEFHRLFGDSDGDSTVAASDFTQFRLAFGGTNSTFDFDNDDAIAASDFTQFRLRFGSSI